MDIVLRQASSSDWHAVADILQEAATWLRDRGIPLWREDELLPEDIRAGIEAELFFLAEVDGEPAGTFRFELSDPVVWPEVPVGESAFVHRLAIRRRYSGGKVSAKILEWAVGRAQNLGLEYLRLDCEAGRPKLRSLYERFGFRHCGDVHADGYLLARYEIRTSQWPPRGQQANRSVGELDAI